MGHYDEQFAELDRRAAEEQRRRRAVVAEHLLLAHEALQDVAKSRETALVATKIEEAQMWLERAK
jgi:hypothetical protein